MVYGERTKLAVVVLVTFFASFDGLERRMYSGDNDMERFTPTRILTDSLSNLSWMDGINLYLSTTYSQWRGDRWWRLFQRPK